MIEGKGGEVRTRAPIKTVRRAEGRVQLRAEGGAWEEFDEVIFACHSDDALQLLEQPTAEEASILGDLRYQSNTAVLHNDVGVMPARKRAWASWVFTTRDNCPSPRIGITYWMNSLQGIPNDDPLFATLNPTTPIRDETIFDTAEFRHPVFDGPAIKAQGWLKAIQGQNNTWFAGAYTRHGFHEDGYASAMAIVDRMRANEGVQ